MDEGLRHIAYLAPQTHGDYVHTSFTLLYGTAYELNAAAINVCVVLVIIYISVDSLATATKLR